MVGVQTEGEETAITPSGSFGLVTNIGPDYTESIGGTRFFGEWKVLTEATAETVGMKERECIVCGCTETEEIPMVSEE